jgi:signal transduction histidine kinase
MANRDWWWLALFVMVSIPVVILGGPIGFSAIVSTIFRCCPCCPESCTGDFSVRAPSVPGAPAELRKLAKDFNRMTAKLEQYEREVRVSSGVAHELRTPLNAAMGRVQGMLDGCSQ